MKITKTKIIAGVSCFLLGYGIYTNNQEKKAARIQTSSIEAKTDQSDTEKLEKQLSEIQEEMNNIYSAIEQNAKYTFDEVIKSRPDIAEKIEDFYNYEFITSIEPGKTYMIDHLRFSHKGDYIDIESTVKVDSFDKISVGRKE